MPYAQTSPGSQLALVQLTGRMRRALGLFRKLTGLNAVASLATSFPEPGTPLTLAPPVHPQCARRLRSVPAAPCREQWRVHLRSGRRSQLAHTHTCPIGLRCSCIPVHFRGQFIGVAKLVVGPDTSEPALKTAVGVLKLVVDETCQDAAVKVLSEELRESRQRLTELQHVLSGAKPGADETDVRSAALVDRALAHLQTHFQDSALSLLGVAQSLGCNPRYLTTRFSKIVGERMHTYLVALRVSHACRLLMENELRVKEVAFASGFSGAGRLDSAFRRRVGVSPGKYRRIFSSS